MSKYLMNRLSNSTNPYQGDYKKVLTVCSAGLLRSPTAAMVLSKPPYNYNTRAAGISPEFALIAVDEVLLAWADEIVCMTRDQEHELNVMLKKTKYDKKIICLHISDNYGYRDKELIKLIKKRYKKAQDE